MKRAVQEQENQEHCHRHDDHQSLRRGLQVFKLSTPAQEVSRRELVLEMVVDRGLGLGHETCDVAAADIDPHDRAMLNVFALDLVGALLPEQSRRDLSAGSVVPGDRRPVSSRSCRRRCATTRGAGLRRGCRLSSSNTVPTVVPPSAATESSTSEALMP